MVGLHCGGGGAYLAEERSMQVWVKDIRDDGEQEEHGGDDQGTGVKDHSKFLNKTRAPYNC